MMSQSHSQVPSFEQFTASPPDLEALIKQFPIIERKLSGTIVEPFNIYEQTNGVVVSWTLDQGKTHNPTIGRIPAGEFEFPTAHRESIFILEGGENCIDIDGATYSKDDLVIVPAEHEIKIVAHRDVLYFCQYKPEAEMGTAWVVTLPEDKLGLGEAELQQEIKAVYGEEQFVGDSGFVASAPLHNTSDFGQLEHDLHEATPDTPILLIAVKDAEEGSFVTSLCSSVGAICKLPQK